MRTKEKAIFLTAEQLEERAIARIRQAERLPPGEARQHALKNATQLRSFAAMKSLFAADRPRAASDVNGESDGDN